MLWGLKSSYSTPSTSFSFLVKFFLDRYRHFISFHSVFLVRVITHTRPQSHDKSERIWVKALISVPSIVDSSSACMPPNSPVAQAESAAPGKQ
jgi:hypothetical protein